MNCESENGRQVYPRVRSESRDSSKEEPGWVEGKWETAAGRDFLFCFVVSSQMRNSTRREEQWEHNRFLCSFHSPHLSLHPASVILATSSTGKGERTDRAPALCWGIRKHFTLTSLSSINPSGSHRCTKDSERGMCPRSLSQELVR